jgi:hypothetical protein
MLSGSGHLKRAALRYLGLHIDNAQWQALAPLENAIEHVDDVANFAAKGI